MWHFTNFNMNISETITEKDFTLLNKHCEPQFKLRQLVDQEKFSADNCKQEIITSFLWLRL